MELFKNTFPQNCLLGIGYAGTEFGHVLKYFIDMETPIRKGIVPAGYAAEGVEVLLLGDDGNEVGPNTVGQIAIKSRYLSPGYWGRPDLTNAVFLPDPEGGDERIYLTGDLGRRSPDGCFVHLGRKDERLKIRGFRVEPAEVEDVLLGLEGVNEAVVVARADRPDEQRLVAYLVLAESPAPTVSAVRRALYECLPSFMVPSAFVVLDALPRTPNGKVDRQALPSPGQGRPELEGAYGRKVSRPWVFRWRLIPTEDRW